MTFTEELLSQRELITFIGVENHSTPYNPLLFNRIWELYDLLPSKDLLIIPINGLEKSYMLSKERIMCYGRYLWVLFVDSPFFLHYTFLFETFPQTDDNNYFTTECIQFLQNINCCTVAVCDIGVYRSRSLVNLLNKAISSLEICNITVGLVTILGYNSRGFTDIETEDEKSTYQKEYYLHSNIEPPIKNNSFYFIQVDRKFNLSDLFEISCQVKNPAELKLQEIEKQAEGYINILKPLWDAGVLRTFIKTLNKGDSFDFISLESKLNKWGFNGNLIDKQWNCVYDRLCRNIRMSNQNNRGAYVIELISAIGKNINSTINFVKSI